MIVLSAERSTTERRRNTFWSPHFTRPDTVVWLASAFRTKVAHIFYVHVEHKGKWGKYKIFLVDGFIPRGLSTVL